MRWGAAGVHFWFVSVQRACCVSLDRKPSDKRKQKQKQTSDPKSATGPRPRRGTFMMAFPFPTHSTFQVTLHFTTPPFPHSHSPPRPSASRRSPPGPRPRTTSTWARPAPKANPGRSAPRGRGWGCRAGRRRWRRRRPSWFNCLVGWAWWVVRSVRVDAHHTHPFLPYITCKNAPTGWRPPPCRACTPRCPRAC